MISEMTEQQFRQPLYREFESLGLFVYILIITDLSAYSNERYEWLLLGACSNSSNCIHLITLRVNRLRRHF